MTRSLIFLVFTLAILFFATGSTAQITKWEGAKADHLIEVALLTDDNIVENPYFGDYRGEGGPYYASPSFFFAIFLSQRGHNTTFLSNLGDHYGSVEDEVIEVLSNTPVLVVPTLDIEGPPPQDLPEVFTQYLNNGGVVVWTGDLESLSGLLSLNFTVVEANNGPIEIKARQLTEEVFEKTEAAQDTPFANGPAFVEDWERDQVANMTTGWPEEAVCLYAAEQDGEELCAVFFMPVGEGVVVYLGWSYYAFDWPAYDDGIIKVKTREVEERDVMTKQWKEVFLLAVEGFVELPNSSSSDHSQDGNSESSQDGQSEDSFAERLTPFVF
ncbi:hypothetical protein QOT17_011019 [Balamuthia mandrillaris]